MLGNTHDAEDIAQQTFLKGLANIRQIRSDELFGAWIGRIAKNLCIDLIRERKRGRSSLAGWLPPDQEDEREFPELRSALAGLSERHRLALMLYYFDGRSTRGLAEVLAISEGAAQARLSRARKKLRRLLEAGRGK
jgi:RNA polymerase sigma-70 factor (ECF subfamily)